MATILIVDDRLANREYLVTLLGYGGHRLFEAANGAEALQLVRRERPDLVIADIVMPTMDGYEFARQLRADPAIAATKLIFFTSSVVVSETRHLAGAVGVTHIIAKPAEPDLILATVADALQSDAPPLLAEATDEFHREHMRLLTDTLANKVEELEAEIVERKQAEVALRESQAMFEKLFNSSPTSIVLASLPDGRIVQANQSYLDLTGYRADELIGRTTTETGVVVDEASRAARLEALAQTGRLAALDVTLTTKSGEIRTGLVSATAITLNGQPFVISTFLDITERKQAEVALRESQAMFETLFNSSPTSIALSRLPDTRIVQANQSYLDLTGYRADELIGRTGAETGVVLRGTNLAAQLATLARTGRLAAVDVSVTTKSGEVRAGLVSATAITLNGEAYVISTILDLTDRQRAEAQVRLQSAALNAAANAIVITDPAGVILWVNPAFTSLTGYSAEAVVGQSTRLLNSGQQSREFYQQLWTTISSGQIWQGEMVNRRQDGSLYTQDQTITPLRDAQGQISHYIAIQQDITARKQAEAQIRHLATVLENVVDGVVSTDLDFRIQSWNAGAEAMLGYRAEEVVGRPYQELLNYEYLDMDEAAAQQEFLTTGRWRGEVRARRKDGQPIYVLVASATVKDPDGKVLGNSVVLHDITVRRQAEEALAASEASLRALFAAMTDVVIVLDADGRYVQIAPTNPANLIRPADELLGRMIDDFIPAGEAGAFHEHIRLALQEQRPLQIQYSLDLDGSLSWFDATIAPMGAGRVIWIARDVTARVQREHELQAIAAVSTALRTANTPAQILPIILENVTALLAARAAAIGLSDPQTGDIVITLGLGEMAGLGGSHVPAGTGIAGQVLATGRPYTTADARTDQHAYKPNWIVRAKAVACVPLAASERVLGTLWAGRPAPFTELDVRVLSAIADLAANALQRAQLREQMEGQLRRLAALREIDQAIMGSLDLRLTLTVIVGHVTAQLQVDACSILDLNRSLNVLEYAAGRGFRTAGIERTRNRVGEGYSGRAALERRLIRVADLREAGEQFHRAALLADEEFVTLICLPLLVKGQVVGVVWHRSPLNPDAEWLAYLETLAGQIAIAISDARLFSDLQRSNQDMRLAYDTTLEGWSAALDLRDKDTEGHSQRVTELTLQLARAMGISGAELEHIRRGALLHDIGKMGIPDAILHKPGPLTDEEWVEMRRHPVYAFELLAPITFLRSALDIPYCHHEWWDGTGYPRQLAGEAIPLAARMFAVVDVWDALRSDRPYRAGWPRDKVRAHLLAQAGTHFDPQVVRAFLSLPDNR